MNKKFKRIVSLTICASIALSSFIGTQLFSSAVGQVETVVFEETQTAGISGFRKMWDAPVVISEDGVPAKTVPTVDGSKNGPGLRAVWNPEDPLRNNGEVDGTLVFDAVHRSMLVRFPGFAETVATKISEGKVVKNAYIELEQIGTELWAENYNSYNGLSFFGDSWAKSKPNWHAQAYALRKPWSADKIEGPTFNANINGTQYWAKYGARDTEQDRFPTRFKQINDFASNENIGKVDITATFNDATFGTSLTKRLETIEQNGFIVNKEEYYDLSGIGVTQYEFGTGRGMQGILVKKPKLVVEFESGTAVSVEKKNYALDMQAYKSQIANTPKAGFATAVTPTEDEYKVLKDRFARKTKPEEMPDWQWDNIEKLRGLSSGAGDAKAFPQTYEAYKSWLDKQLERQIRAWQGWDVTDNLFVVANYQEAMPGPVLDHWKFFYYSVLNPHTATKDIITPMFNSEIVLKNIAEKNDWRSDASLFRHYSRGMGTMNYNYQFSAVTLIGGVLIGNKMIEDEGRHGLEKFPSYYWTWYDGTTQESIDHYYLGHSIASQKMFVDYGPTLYDRTVGKNIMAKTVEELATLFHPRLKRFISTSGRTTLALVFGENEGISGIMHTLSQRGAYLDLRKDDNNKYITTVNYTNTKSFPVHGYDFKPATVAELATVSPWGPDWMTDIIDNKAFPVTSVSKYKKWGHYENTPIYKTSYLGNYYGMSSMDVAANEAVPFMGQWIRTTDDATSMTDVGTLISRPGLNRTKLYTSYGGVVPFQGLTQATMQIKNKAINMFSPSKQWKSFSYDKEIPAQIKSIQGTIGLYNFSEDQSWELWVDNNPIDMGDLPLTISQEQNIMIKDGVSYIAITPLESTHLDGKESDNVVLSVGSTLEPTIKGKTDSFVKEALRIDSYLYNSEVPLSEGAIGWDNLDKAYGGFAVEMADQTQYSTFAAFKTAILNSKVSAKWNVAESLVEASYESGNDKLEMGYYPLYPKNLDERGEYFNEDQLTTDCFKYRNYNGVSMLTSDTIDRETALAIQGTSGTLEKNGATLLGGKGQKLYLLASTSNKIYNALNPAQDIGLFSLALPEGRKISANGLVGVVNATYYENKNLVELEYAVRPGQDLSVMANAFYFDNFPPNTTVKFNGTVAPKISKPSGGFAIATDSRTPNLNVLIDSLWKQLGSFSAKVDVEKIKIGEKIKLNVDAKYIDGSAVDPSQLTYTYKFETPNIVKGEGQYITGNSDGSVKFKVTVSLNGIALTSADLYIEVGGGIFGSNLVEIKVNVASNKLVTMPGNPELWPGWLPKYVTDGTINSYVQTKQRIDYSLVIDLGQVYKVSSIKQVAGYDILKKLFNDSMHTSVDYYYSVDGVNWNYISRVQKEVGEPVVIAFPEVSARYIKYDGKNARQQGNWGANVNEIEVFEKRYVTAEEAAKMGSGSSTDKETSGTILKTIPGGAPAIIDPGNPNPGIRVLKKPAITGSKINEIATGMPWIPISLVLALIVLNVGALTFKGARKRKLKLAQSSDIFSN
jgi:hypothetical protein